MRILVLEESKSTRNLLRTRLERAGYTVDTADNGHQGFQRATANAYDVILCNIAMPHWDGFKFIEAIQVVAPHLPILVIVPASGDHAIRARLHQYSSVLGILAEPFDFDALLKRLAAVPRQTHASVNKKAKIVCTIGPSSNTPEILGKMILAGMDVARLNFSHGSYETHEAALAAVREAEKAWEKPIAVLQDLCGPKIRTGPMQGGAVQLLAGEVLAIQADPMEGTAQRFSTVAPEILADLRTGDPVLLDDGLLELRVLREGAREVLCEVVVGGMLKSGKGINLPQTDLSLPGITAKDWQDLDWGLNHSVDYLALSFVRSAEDIRRIKQAIAVAGKRHLKVVAKIEKPEAVRDIREIAEAADAVMIARGDMGVELPAARVPRIQERIIQLCWELNTPVITATQMLDSMTVNVRPTRAEVTDVSMAIKEGTDAVMLSQETATGIDPVNAVRTMASIICEEERHARPSAEHFRELEKDAAVYPALSAVAQFGAASAILLLDPDGTLYPLLSKWNRKAPILLVTGSLHVARHASLYHSIFPLIVKEELDRADMVLRSLTMAREGGYIHADESIAVVEGSRITRRGIRQMASVQVIRMERE
ncbi:pyruvate kinase [Desulfobulbus sp.]|uniref:pyruvate kinase n=1 Tax=Desulfobulbus sp. TaxID=895 RepID=UPI00286F0FC7|nr:pyruvate kinase [Desulfobulbus sp.]